MFILACMTKWSEKELIARLKDTESQNQAFNYLVSSYKEKIYWQVRRMVLNHYDADDIVQNVFIKIFQNLGKFRGDSSLYTWIYRITVNEIFSHLKSLQKRKIISFESMAQKLEQKLVTDEFFSDDQIQLKFQKAILRLPEKQRLVFNMKYFDENVTFEELSEILDTSTGALKASYHHAVKKIEKILKED